MNRSPPRFVTKNLVRSCFLPCDTSKSHAWVMFPARFKVPSMFFDCVNSVELLCAQPEPSDCFVVDKIGRRSTVNQCAFFHLALEIVQIEWHCHRVVSAYVHFPKA